MNHLKYLNEKYPSQRWVTFDFSIPFPGLNENYPTFARDLLSAGSK